MTASDSARALRAEAEATAAYFSRVQIAAEKIAFSLAYGRHGRRRAGLGETFWQHRPYSFGDPVSAIDWRQSARSGSHLYVRQNEWEAANAVWIWRDPTASMAYGSSPDVPTKRFRADILTVALAIVLADAGERVGVIGGASASPTGTSRLFQGRGTARRVLEHLDHGETEATHEVPVNISARPGQRIVMISDFFMDPEILGRAMQIFAARGVHGVLLRVLDSAEESFPFRGRTEFLDMEGPGRLLFGRAGSLRDEYRAAYSAHVARIERLALTAGWPLVPHRTDTPARAGLSPVIAFFENGPQASAVGGGH